MITQQEGTDYARVERAIGFLAESVGDQPKLADVAEAVGLSPHRTQRLFRRWAGVSPKRFLEFLTVEHAKGLLERSVNVLDTSLAVGLSGPSRLHDHFVKLEAMSPGEYKSAGEGVGISCGVHDSPFGLVFVAESERGVCRLAFFEGDDSARDEASHVAELETAWPAAEIVRDSSRSGETVERIFGEAQERDEILVRVTGTNFQLAVWKALLAIPPGRLVSYQAVAEAAGRPEATRAVASAIGANPVAYLIPCHRVIRKTGALGGYRWGAARKQALLAWESARFAG